MAGTLPNILTKTEVQSLLQQFNTRYSTSYRNKVMIQVAYTLGLRVSEILNLTWNCIEKNRGKVFIQNGKGNKDRIVYAAKDLIESMISQSKKFTNDQHAGYIFTTLKGKPVKDAYLRKMITAKGKKAGITKRVHFHLLRHTCLTEIYQETKNIRLVQEIAGHTDLSTTMIYTHIHNEDIQAVMRNRESNDKPDPPVDELDPEGNPAGTIYSGNDLFRGGKITGKN